MAGKGAGKIVTRTEFAFGNAAVLRAADELYVLADHTKFEGGRLFSICDMSAVNRIITDSGVPDHIRKVGRELYLPIDYV